MTSGLIMNALAAKHAKDFFIEECKGGPTWFTGHLRMDAWAMKRSWANPLSVGYEVKVSRNDFVRDDKYPGYLPFCNELYLVAPKDMIAPFEVHAEVGLMEAVGKKGSSARRRLRDGRLPCRHRKARWGQGRRRSARWSTPPRVPGGDSVTAQNRLRGKRPAGSIDQVNAIAALLGPHKFERRAGRLFLTTDRSAIPYGSFERSPCIIRPDGLWPACGEWGNHGCGGTHTQALVQLVHWLRGEPRMTLRWWRWQWRGEGKAANLLAALEASEYAAGDATHCVLCGSPKVGDWWSLDGVSGPCCYRTCNDVGRPCTEVFRAKYGKGARR
ncbi:MAG TPA: hypothetical protein VGM37_01300 [Armatimonadota bacterium]|jgi:hypothetical protein